MAVIIVVSDKETQSTYAHINNANDIQQKQNGDYTAARSPLLTSSAEAHPYLPVSQQQLDAYKYVSFSQYLLTWTPSCGPAILFRASMHVLIAINLLFVGATLMTT